MVVLNRIYTRTGDDGTTALGSGNVDTITDYTTANDTIRLDHLVFAGILLIVASLYFGTSISRTLLFWMAFILTRPLGATVGDILTKPHADGGLDLSRITSSAVIAVFIIGCIALTSQAAGGHPGMGEKT